MGQFTSPGGTELIAPENKFRVVGVDTYDREPCDWVQGWSTDESGDFDTQEEAIRCAKKNGDRFVMMHVYDDEGNHLFSAGTVT